jgi:hypothetical protein
VSSPANGRPKGQSNREKYCQPYAATSFPAGKPELRRPNAPIRTAPQQRPFRRSRAAGKPHPAPTRQSFAQRSLVHRRSAARGQAGFRNGRRPKRPGESPRGKTRNSARCLARHWPAVMRNPVCSSSLSICPNGAEDGYVPAHTNSCTSGVAILSPGHEVERRKVASDSTACASSFKPKKMRVMSD